MKIVVQMKFGSSIYGTRTPSSDLDLKSVFIPEYRDIILGTAQDTINTVTKVDVRAKNTSEDVDDERFSLKQFFKLLSEGQTGALDMLFCPEAQIIESSDLWRHIQFNRDKFIHSGAAAFVGYCRKQANKYGIKGSRVAAVRTWLEFLNECPPYMKLSELSTQIDVFMYKKEFMSIVSTKGPNGELQPHVEIVNRKVPMTATVKYTIDIYQPIFDNYGARSLAAEANAGLDWKALSHAVRVKNEALELLKTGFITFPRPEAQHLLAIKLGQVDYKIVAEEIESGLEEVEAAALVSSLPKKPNKEFIDNLIFEVYSGVWK